MVAIFGCKSAYVVTESLLLSVVKARVHDETEVEGKW